MDYSSRRPMPLKPVTIRRLLSCHKQSSSMVEDMSTTNSSGKAWLQFQLEEVLLQQPTPLSDNWLPNALDPMKIWLKIFLLQQLVSKDPVGDGLRITSRPKSWRSVQLPIRIDSATNLLPSSHFLPLMFGNMLTTLTIRMSDQSSSKRYGKLWIGAKLPSALPLPKHELKSNKNTRDTLTTGYIWYIDKYKDS